MEQEKSIISEDSRECSSSNLSLVQAIKSELDSKQEQKMVTIKNSENIHFGDIFIQDPLYGIGNLHKFNPMQTISNRYEELFTIWKERLMNHYKTDNAYMRSLFWKNKRNDFPIKEYFVDLKVQKSELLGFKTGEYVQLKQIFQKDVRNHVIILVTGDPGYGKTTLCKKIAYDWGENDPSNDYLSRFDFVVVIVLRELKGRTVINAVLDKLSNSDDDSYSTIKKELRRAKFNFLVILDGFDETFDQSSVINFIKSDSVKIAKNMTILLTSRPYAVEEIREYVTDRFFLEGFSPEQKKKYIELVIKEDMEMKKRLLHLVNTDIFYGQLGECPLMLHMLCCLPDTKYLKKINTQTDLYVRIFRLIIKRYRKKKDVEHDLKKGKLFYGEDILTKLGELLHEKRSNKQFSDIFELFITNEDLKRKFCIQQEYDFIVSLDILSRCFEKNDVIYFDTLHETFADFLINLYIYSCFISIPHFEKTGFSFFLFGLFNNEIFPENFMKFIRKFIPNQSVWYESYKEIKDKDNKELFLLNTKLLINYGTLNHSIEMIQHFHFTQIYYVIPESKHFYEPLRNELIQFHKAYNYSNELEIFLILDSSFSTDPLMNSSTGFRDIRNITTTIKNLLNSYSWKKFKFYLFGIYPYTISQPITVYMKNIHVFNKIENAKIPKEIRTEIIKSKEAIVSLHSVSKPFRFPHYSFDEQGLREIKILQTNTEIQNLISAEVFKYLKPYIKLDSEDTNSV